MIITANPDQDADSTPTPGQQHLSLRAFLERLKAHVATVTGAWITAEVVKADKKGRSFYLELAETDENGAPVAKVNANIWRNIEGVLAPFRTATGAIPRPGMRLLLHVRPTFDPVYGLKLEIDKIDPSFTLGDIERSLQEMRQRLREAGHYDRNRSFPCPSDYFRVAILSPVEAAALGDFRETADRLEQAGLCSFDYKYSSFQGNRAAEGLIGALHEFVHAHRITPFCAVCIIRGGGSVADLAELNQLRIAAAICHAPLPVLTGIGHERDWGLLDDVACRSFDTPSKVVLHIERAILESAQAAGADWQTIRGEARHGLDAAQRKIESVREAIAAGSAAAIHSAERTLARNLQSIASGAAATLATARIEQDMAHESLHVNALRALTDARRAIAADMEQALGLGPAHTLARGFAIVRDPSGRVLPNRAAALAADSLAIEFNDGAIPVRRTTDGN